MESRENSHKMWLLNVLQHPPVGRFPMKFSELCGKGFSPHIDPDSCGNKFRGP